MRNGLNFNHLECFFSLARTLSFSKTSELLTIAQPAVSKQIKSLEEFFGQQLFLRTRQQVQLTGYGKNLFEQLSPLYAEICNRVDTIITEDDSIRGKLVFGCLSEVGERVFVKPLSLFKTEHPGITIEIRFLKGFEIIEGIKAGVIDVGIVSEKLIQENIRCYEVLSEEIILVRGAKGGAEKLEQLSDTSFVSYRENDPLLQYYLQKAFPRTKLSKLNIEFMVNSHKSMVEVLKGHNYCSVLPTLSIGKELENGTLVNVGPKNLKSNLYLLHLDLEFEDPKVKTLSSFLKKYLKSHYL